jgi:LPS sulfotransferase NodH
MSEKYCRSLEDFLAWDPIVSKVHCHHFGAYIVDRPLLKSRIPKVRFVLLERKDRVAQSVSLAMSNCTSVTQCSTRENQVTYHQRRVSLNDDDLLGCYRAVGDYQNFWKNWLHSEPHLVVSYEALVENAEETVAQIFDYLRTPCPRFEADVPLRKLEHPQTQNFILRLRLLLAQCPEPASMDCVG